MSRIQKTVCLITMLLLVCSAASLRAQPAPGDGGGFGGPAGPGGGSGGPPDPEMIRQMMMDRVQREMGVSDDEFQALAPTIEKVMELKRDSDIRPMRPGDHGRPGGPDGMGGPGGDPGNPQGDQSDGPPRPPESAIQLAADAVHTTLGDKNATPDDVKAKVDAMRQAKIRAKADLVAAQQDLQKKVTPREEAALVELGLLD